MRKFILTICACLLLVTDSAHAAILKDDAGFSYVNSYNNLIFSQAVRLALLTTSVQFTFSPTTIRALNST